MRRFKSREIIFETTIDFDYHFHNKDIYLSDEVQSLENKKLPSRAQVAEYAKNVVEYQLPAELEHLYGFHVKIRLVDTRPGSRSLFFAAVFSVYTIIGGYKSFFDSIELIKEHTDRLLKSGLRERFNIPNWEVHTESKYPAFKSHKYTRDLRHAIMEGDIDDLEEIISPTIVSTDRQRRDPLFYYLLILNIFLLAIIATLVFSAVKKTYFPEHLPNKQIERTLNSDAHP